MSPVRPAPRLAVHARLPSAEALPTVERCAAEAGGFVTGANWLGSLLLHAVVELDVADWEALLAVVRSPRGLSLRAPPALPADLDPTDEREVHLNLHLINNEPERVRAVPAVPG